MAKTFVLFEILCFLVLLPDSFQDYAGIKVKFSQKGLDYGADLVIGLLMQRLNQKSLSDVNGQEGKLKYEIKNIKIKELSRPDFTATFNEEKQTMIWSLINSKITATADWKFDWRKNRIIRLKDSGGLVVSTNDISMEVEWKLKYDPSTGKPIIETTQCKSRVGNIDLKFGGKIRFVYDVLFRFGKKSINDLIERSMCAAAINALNNDANEEMKTMHVGIKLTDDLAFNFKLVSTPHISSACIESFHSGCTYTNQDEDCPSDHPTMTRGTDNRMLSLSLSENVIDNLIKKAFENGVIETFINSKDFSDKENNFLDTSCKASLCMRSFFSKLANKHPNSSFEIDFKATKSPLLTMKGAQIKSSLEASSAVYIKKPDSKRIEIFTTSIVTDLDVSARIEKGNVLIGEIIKFNPKISLVDLTTEDVSSKNIKFLGKFLGRMIVKKANNAAKQGLPLLSISNIGWSNTDVSIEEGYIHLQTDLIYKHEN